MTHSQQGFINPGDVFVVTVVRRRACDNRYPTCAQSV